MRSAVTSPGEPASPGIVAAPAGEIAAALAARDFAGPVLLVADDETIAACAPAWAAAFARAGVVHRVVVAGVDVVAAAAGLGPRVVVAAGAAEACAAARAAAATLGLPLVETRPPRG